MDGHRIYSAFIFLFAFCVLLALIAGVGFVSAKVVLPEKPLIEAKRLGLEGYCPVTLMEGKRWELGSPNMAEIQDDTLYLFCGEVQRETFLENPDKFLPAYHGNDLVIAVEQGKQVPGKRAHGIFFQGKVYLFVNAENMERFLQNPQRYLSNGQPVASAQQARRF